MQNMYKFNKEVTQIIQIHTHITQYNASTVTGEHNSLPVQVLLSAESTIPVGHLHINEPITLQHW